MSVQSLVEAVQRPAVDITGLWDTYQSMVSRSLAERRKLQLELAAMSDSTVFSVIDLFGLPEAWDGSYPRVALAPIEAATINFQQEGYEFTRFWTGGQSKKGKLKLESELRIINPDPSNRGYRSSGSAKVPLIPKSVAPGFISRVVKDHWVMFDTPAWLDKKMTPVDPYLLQRIDKQRFRVLAHWDLTQKERQLMALLG